MLSISHANSMESSIGKNGLAASQLLRYAREIKSAHSSILKQRGLGSLGFFDLPYQSALAKKIQGQAKKWRGRFENFVVLGIGGSALGNIALQNALRHPYWNLLPQQERQGWLKLFVIDNVDPTLTQGLLDAVDLRKTLVNVVSKSGTTAECLANYFIVRKAVEKKVGKSAARKHFIFTTDPQKGYLHELAREQGIQTFGVPGNVGGRFSILSPVGLVSAAAAGIDISEILAGARRMEQRCRNHNLFKNPAALFALVHFLFYQRKRPIHVMIPYSNQLKEIADWFRQLWAESLGKKTDRAGKKIFVGPTPVKALGVTDQHSQIQLYIEGPQDKVLTFLSVQKLETDLAIPGDEGHYLSKKSLAQLFKAEEKATIAALSKEGRPNLTITLPSITAASLGELLFMLELATAYAGELFNINAFDQPGVEQAKILTDALMGREGYSRRLADYKKWL